MAQSVKFQLRRDTAANWAGNNPILALGEPGYAVVDGTTGGNRMKIGNGQTGWNALPYVDCGTTGATGPTGPTGPTGAVGQGSWTAVVSNPTEIIQSTTVSGRFNKIAPSGWSGYVSSVQSYSSGCYASFTLGFGTSFIGLGVSGTNPAAIPTGIENSIYVFQGTTPGLFLYANGVNIPGPGNTGGAGSWGPSAVGDNFNIQYDGANITFYQNGVQVGPSVARTLRTPLYLYAIQNEQGSFMSNLVFGSGGGSGGGDGGLTGPTGPTGTVSPIYNSDNTINTVTNFNTNNIYRSLITDTSPTGPWNTLNTVPAITFAPVGTRPYQDYLTYVNELIIVPNDSGGMTGNTGGRQGCASLSLNSNPAPTRGSIGLTFFVPAVTGGGLTQDCPSLWLYGAAIGSGSGVPIWTINPLTGITIFNYPISAPNVPLSGQNVYTQLTGAPPGDTGTFYIPENVISMDVILVGGGGGGGVAYGTGANNSAAGGGGGGSGRFLITNIPSAGTISLAGVTGIYKIGQGGQNNPATNGGETYIEIGSRYYSVRGGDQGYAGTNLGQGGGGGNGGSGGGAAWVGNGLPATPGIGQSLEGSYDGFPGGVSDHDVQSGAGGYSPFGYFNNYSISTLGGGGGGFGGGWSYVGATANALSNGWGAGGGGGVPGQGSGGVGGLGGIGGYGSIWVKYNYS